MGISRGAIRLLGMQFDGRRAAGNAVTYGVQQVDATSMEAAALLRVQGKPSAQAGGGPISQEALFRLLGFASVESIDLYDAESPTHVMDLNRPVPAALHGRYDLVYDGGTLEHCFSTATVLCNTLRLVKRGGRVIHHVPLNNWIDHGFYQFSPTLFFDFYRANGFDDLSMVFHFIGRKRESYVPYDPQDHGRLPFGFGGATKAMIFFGARKAAELDEPVFPVQGRYRRAFGGEAARPAPLSAWGRLRRSLVRRTYRLRAKPL